MRKSHTFLAQAVDGAVAFVESDDVLAAAGPAAATWRTSSPAALAGGLLPGPCVFQAGADPRRRYALGRSRGGAIAFATSGDGGGTWAPARDVADGAGRALRSDGVGPLATLRAPGFYPPPAPPRGRSAKRTARLSPTSASGVLSTRPIPPPSTRARAQRGNGFLATF